MKDLLKRSVPAGRLEKTEFDHLMDLNQHFVLNFSILKCFTLNDLKFTFVLPYRENLIINI